MPTIVSHGIVAAAGARAALGSRASRRLLAAAAIGSMIPDADVISFVVGIPYVHWLGHRGFSHSLLFAAIAGGVLAWIVRRGSDREAPSRSFGLDWLVLTLATASHGLADALTNGGEGVAFFAPLENSRYFFPWPLIEVSPIGMDFFTGGDGMIVVVSELKVLVLPALVFTGIVEIARRRGGREAISSVG